jgi:uncharacterized membrane protein YdjX (TVP38/TMEM64 family)
MLWRPLLLVAVVITLFVVARALNLGERFGELRTWIESLGIWGPIVFIFIYAAGVVAALPGSAMTIAAGALFGSFEGVIIVVFAATFGASLAFLISRYFARGSIARWLENKEKFRKLDELTERHGAIIVALTRLAPIFPFNLLNYGFGLTKVRFWTYVIWSFICMLPGTILYVVGSDAVFQAIEKGEVPWILVGVFAIAIVVLVLVVRYARGWLREKGAPE